METKFRPLTSVILLTQVLALAACRGDAPDTVVAQPPTSLGATALTYSSDSVNVYKLSNPTCPNEVCPGWGAENGQCGFGVCAGNQQACGAAACSDSSPCEGLTYGALKVEVDTGVFKHVCLDDDAYLFVNDSQGLARITGRAVMTELDGSPPAPVERDMALTLAFSPLPAGTNPAPIQNNAQSNTGWQYRIVAADGSIYSYGGEMMPVTETNGVQLQWGDGASDDPYATGLGGLVKFDLTSEGTPMPSELRFEATQIVGGP